jgi:hypothetical protein
LANVTPGSPFGGGEEMSHSTHLKFSFSILAFLALACASMPTFAQRGGHGGSFRGGGGGFHGGGGFRGGGHSFARPSMGRIHGRPGGFGSSRFNTSRVTGSRFSSDFGRSRFGVRNSIISQPRFGFGDGHFDFDDGFGFRGFGFGCFGCSFGWGWGFGSWSWWSPWWPSTWWGWPASNVYPYSNPNPANVAESAPITLLYLKDGTTLAATDYWVEDSKLHYRVSDGGESTLDMNDLDLQRTVDENAKRGVPFTLKPQPVSEN